MTRARSIHPSVKAVSRALPISMRACSLANTSLRSMAKAAKSANVSHSSSWSSLVKALLWSLSRFKTPLTLPSGLRIGTAISLTVDSKRMRYLGSF